MDLTFSEEQEALRAYLQRFVEERAPVARTREEVRSSPGFNIETWLALATELGVIGLQVPTDLGGQGGSHVDVAIACQQLGRGLYSGPYLATSLAVSVLLACSDDGAARRLLTPILAGDAVWSVDTASLTNHVLQGEQAPSVVKDGRLNGTLQAVLHAEAADGVLFLGTGRDGSVSLYGVETKHPDVACLPVADISGTRRAADIVASGAPVDVLAPAVTDAAVAAAFDRGAVSVAAELVGVAEGALDTTVAHARTREQFSRPIGSFQAVQHALVDVLVELEHARTALYVAACYADLRDEDALHTAASLALGQALEAAALAVATGVQVLGGIGFTWEHDAHLRVRRAIANGNLLGSARAHRHRVTALTGVEGRPSRDR